MGKAAGNRPTVVDPWLSREWEWTQEDPRLAPGARQTSMPLWAGVGPVGEDAVEVVDCDLTVAVVVAAGKWRDWQSPLREDDVEIIDINRRVEVAVSRAWD